MQEEACKTRLLLHVKESGCAAFFDIGVRAEFGPQSTFSTYTPPKK